MWTAHSEFHSLEASWNKSSVSFQRERSVSPLSVDVGDLSGVVKRHQNCGVQRKGEPLEGFGHCSHLQQIDVESVVPVVPTFLGLRLTKWVFLAVCLGLLHV